MKQRKRSATYSVTQGEVLVAVMNSQRDFNIVQEQGWYRIPVARAPKFWPPKWLAFYQTKIFGAEAFAVNYYARIQSIQIVQRRELFPNEIASERSERKYYQVHLQALERLPQPIPSTHWRRIVFIPTTWVKLNNATEINDLFADSPLEDRLWDEFKRNQIHAERQWELMIDTARYFLDFALFCTKGRINIETDGDTWHTKRERIPEDNKRDNALQSAGWHVLRFNGHQIRESLAETCLPQITTTINVMGGLSDEGIVPRKFYNAQSNSSEQLSLFDDGIEYELD